MREKIIPTPKMSEILKEEFMDPLNLSSYELAKKIEVPTSRIQDLLHDRRRMTIDTSIRSGKFFNVFPKFFLNIQNDIDLRNAELRIKKYIIAFNPSLYRN